MAFEKMGVDLTNASEIVKHIVKLENDIKLLKKSYFYNEYYHAPMVNLKQNKLDLLSAVKDKFPESEIINHTQTKKNFEDFINIYFKKNPSVNSEHVLESKTEDILNEKYKKLFSDGNESGTYKPYVDHIFEDYLMIRICK
jgi:hypothetical protein